MQNSDKRLAFFHFPKFYALSLPLAFPSWEEAIKPSKRKVVVTCHWSPRAIYSSFSKWGNSKTRSLPWKREKVPSKSRCQTKTKNIVFFLTEGPEEIWKRAARENRGRRVLKIGSRLLLERAAARKCGKHYAGTRMRIDSAGSRATRRQKQQPPTVFHTFDYDRFSTPECGCESCLEYFPQDARRNVRDLPCGFCTRHTRENRKLLESQMDFARHTFGRIFCDHTNTGKGAFN